MAQLKSTTVSGSLRATDTIYSTTIQAQILNAPTASNGATYGPGTNGQVLKSNGTSVYWGTDNNSVTGVKGNSESSYRTGNVNITASNIGLGNVENTKLSTWAGSSNITTVGIITSGTWNGTAISSAYIGSHTHSYAGSSSAGGAATTAVTSADTSNTLYLVGVTSAATTTLKRDTSITMTGGTITATTFSGNLSGNASTATTASSVSRATFGDSSNGEHNANNINSNGLWYYSSNGPASTLGAQSSDGALYSQAYSTSWVGQIAQDYRDGQLFVRGKNNNSWQNWYAIPKFTTSTGDVGGSTTPVYIDTNGNLVACTSYANASVASAATLTTARTLWGQSFDGSANVSGNMTDVGPSMKLPSSQTAFQFLTSSGGAANGQFGKLSLYSTYSNADLNNYVLDVNGATRLVGKVKINYATAATTTTQSGQLIITSGTSTNNVSIELYRNNGASWQIYNNSGTLYFNNNYTTSAQSTYSKTALSLAYNTGNATFSGTATFGGNVTMPTDSTLTIGSGTLTATDYSGNAATATKWYTAQKVYVALGTASKTETIQGGNSNAETIGVDGTLAETNGGTGQNTYTKGQILYASAANTLSKLDIGTAGYTLQATANGPVWTEKVAVANGGTNATSVTKYGIAYGNSSADAYAFTSAGTDGYILIGKGTSAAPEWQEILPISHGGTGTKTAPTQYGVIYASSTTSYASTGAGTANQILVSGGTAAAPSWKATADGAAYASSADGELTFGTLAPKRGGTGVNSYAKGDILYAGGAIASSAETALSKLTIGSEGQVLISNSSSIPEWSNTTDITGVGTVTTGTWEATTIAVNHGGTGATSVTKFGIAYGNSSANGYTFTSAGSDGYILIGKGASTAPTWQQTLPVSHGGTGATSFTANSAIISGSTTTSALTTRGITDNTTAGSNPTANTNLITANTLINYKGTANIDTLGTITTGTWNGSKIDVSYLSSSTANRLVWSQSTGTLIAGNHYASGTQISIASTTAPTSGYALKVNGQSEYNGTLDITGTLGSGSYKYHNRLYNGTICTGVIGNFFGVSSSVPHSQLIFYQASPNSDCTANSGYFERYWLPNATASLSSTADYSILTNKNTVTVEQGGTGATSFTANCAIISGSSTTAALTTRAITNNTSATAVTASTNLITANTLYYHKGNSNIVTVGTITSGTWQGTAIAAAYIGNHSTDKLTSGTLGTARGGTGVASHTANRLVWSTSATAIQATDAHYVSATQMSINFNSAPHSGYTLLVGGHSEINGALSLQQPNASTQNLYFKNHTSTVLSVGARIYWWNGSASGITHSQLNFQEYSYSTTASATLSSFYEQYSLPDCTAGLGANATYNILTDKAVTPFPVVGRAISSSSTFDNLTTPGIYAINNNISSSATFPSSQTHAKYGTLAVLGGLGASSGTLNNTIQLWLSGITNMSNYRLFIRGNYYNSTGWQGWKKVLLAPTDFPEFPTPSATTTYRLKATVSGSTITYSWVSG